MHYGNGATHAYALPVQIVGLAKAKPSSALASTLKTQQAALGLLADKQKTQVMAAVNKMKSSGKTDDFNSQLSGIEQSTDQNFYNHEHQLIAAARQQGNAHPEQQSAILHTVNAFGAIVGAVIAKIADFFKTALKIIAGVVHAIEEVAKKIADAAEAVYNAAKGIISGIESLF